MIVNILSHTPVWVWGLLAALMALGFSQTRQRHVAPWRLLMLPLALLYGGFSGLFLGRSLALLKLTRATAGFAGQLQLRWL